MTLMIAVSIKCLSELFAGTDVKPAGREEQHHNSDVNEICHKQSFLPLMTKAGTCLLWRVIKRASQGVKNLLKIGRLHRANLGAVR